MRHLKCLLGLVPLACGLSAPLAQTAGNAVLASTVPPLEFVTEELPPLNFDKNGRTDGFSTELVHELLRRTGLDASLTVLPWARAYKLARSQPNVGLYSTVRSAEREPLFQWVGPIANASTVFYATRDSDLHLASPADAKNARAVVVLREGYSAQLLRRQGFDNLLFANNNTQAVRLLTVGGAKTLLLIAAITIPETLVKLGLPPDAIKPVLLVARAQFYIAFSLETAPATVKQFQDALDNMKRDGSFAALHRKWLINEKPPGVEREPDLLPFE